MMTRYAIQYRSSEDQSYYREMTGIGPAFGATLGNARLFDSLDDAHREKMRFNIIADTMSEVVEIEEEALGTWPLDDRADAPKETR